MARVIAADLAGACDDAVDVLRSGGVVVIPTDTVYGLAVLPNHADAINRVFALKQRPAGMHLPVLVAGSHQLRLVTGDTRPAVRTLAERFWPGALTMVVANATPLTDGLGNGDGTVGVRCPDHELIRSIAEVVGAVAATSANLHGRPTPDAADEVADQLPGVDLVIDGGICAGGQASTVVSLTGPVPEVLRAGPITAADIVDIWQAGG
jgi:L-threonylcarbamoyladenylate synthase